jgi:hypothetical protein
MKQALEWLGWLFDDTEDPDEPVFDPVQLGAAVLITFTAMGLLYWLLWTLLVFEGGFFPKVLPSLQVLFTSKTMKDFGYQGPWDRGLFEGILGNSVSFILTVAVAWGLRSLYRDAARHQRKR